MYTLKPVPFKLTHRRKAWALVRRSRPGLYWPRGARMSSQWSKRLGTIRAWMIVAALVAAGLVWLIRRW